MAGYSTVQYSSTAQTNKKDDHSRRGIRIEKNIPVLQISFLGTQLEVFFETVTSLQGVDGRGVDASIACPVVDSRGRG